MLWPAALSANQVRPDFSPLIWAELASSDRLVGFALNRDSESDPASLAIHDVAHVADRSSAADRELLAGALVREGFEVFAEFHSPDYTRWCAPCQHQLVSPSASTADMADDALIRLENLKSLQIDLRTLCAKVGGRDTYWRDLLKGNKSFGERIARKIEERFELPRGWLDETHEDRKADPISYEAMRMARRYDSLTPLERARLRRLMDAAVDDPDEDRPQFGDLLGGDSNLGGLDETKDNKTAGGKK